ncbi:response regulator transcription factor [Neorhodopirellula pilleata]|uniref:Transcriptional regulatory protein TdiR n=1 Tax=Neorhodopirellula pilleata TaxID=2714738 RepID=A0A5C6A9G1_9BACT|nr:response regulator [Neorhodopirellula pilleata]TWT94963.1 Transcriptional regulatory protein TdiR [Neorhodopirellula pilleata]
MSTVPFARICDESDNKDLEPTVFLIDDHEVELDLMYRWCQRAGLNAEVFDDPNVLLSRLDHETVGCVVADLRMPQISGLELQAEIARRDLMMPVILVTGHGDAENCRAAFQQGVFDFIEKGFDSIQFIESVERAIRKNQRDRFRHSVRREAREILKTVSPRENEVIGLLASGMPLKGIAQVLNISVQTASKHRTSIFTKLEIDNEVDLYKMLLAAEVDIDAMQPVSQASDN